MRRTERKVLKNNPGLVDMLFEVMFEKLWVVPYDRRRTDVAFNEFERGARRLVVLLGDTDLAAASATQVRELIHSAERLSASISRIEQAGLFPARRCADAADAVLRIIEELKMKTGGGVTAG